MPEQIVRKLFPIEVKELRPDGGTIRINTNVLDRDSDHVPPSGAQIDNYMQAPVVLWAHNYFDPWAIVGRTTGLQIGNDFIDADFTLREAANEHDPQGIVRLLWEGGWVNAASVGFRPVSWEDNDDGGFDYPEWELVEWSLVPVGANQEALRRTMKALDQGGYIEPDGTSTISVGGGWPVSKDDVVANLAKLDAAAGREDDFMQEVQKAALHILALNDLEEKRGRVLSAANENRIKKAVGLLDEVLSQLGAQDDDEKAKGIDEEKPYPNEHACRLRSPEDFDDDSFRRVSRDHDGKDYDVIMGKLEGEDSMTDQAFRYPKASWDADEAAAHCGDHDGSFEAASEEEAAVTEYIIEPEAVLRVFGLSEISAKAEEHFKALLTEAFEKGAADSAQEGDEEPDNDQAAEPDNDDPNVTDKSVDSPPRVTMEVDPRLVNELRSFSKKLEQSLLGG